jgi:hypothetical protein
MFQFSDCLISQNQHGIAYKEVCSAIQCKLYQYSIQTKRKQNYLRRRNEDKLAKPAIA